MAAPHRSRVRRDDSKLMCWGNRAAALELPSEALCSPVEPSQRVVRFREVASTSHAVCGIREADALWTCWGRVQWNPL